MPILIGQQVTEALQQAGNTYKLKVVSNILAAKKNRSGETVRSIRPDANLNTLIVWGRENFHNIETGVSPEEAKQINFNNLKSKIWNWSKYLPLEFNNAQRGRFSFNVSNSLQQKGSLLFQSGGRKDIYSNEEEGLLRDISEKVGQIIVNTQIL